jgi:hypothetical protein
VRADRHSYKCITGYVRRIPPCTYARGLSHDLAIAEVKSNYGDKNASEMVAELEMSWEIMKQQLGGADAETGEKEAV